MELFAEARKRHFQSVAPLAVRMRPRSLDEVVGQRHFLGAGKLLRRLIESDRLASALFYGPPGTGKTSLAQVIANITSAAFEQAHAAAVGVREVRDVLVIARQRLANSGQRTVLFIDELHRFNRAQQDVLLADVEDGIIRLIGATTENPFFTVRSPLISRSQIFQFEPLSEDDIRVLIGRALADRERGLGGLTVELTEEARDFLAVRSDGDARRALNGLEVAVLSQLAEKESSGGPVRVDLSVVAESIQQKALVYDKAGDQHYDSASALIKSMRGSDPDATVYWLARMLEGGEDPRFIARRIAICAAEDVGNADPMATVLANAAVQISEFVGLPECQLPLAQAAIYVACAPKSNACTMAILSAREDVRTQRTVPVPKRLRDASYRGAQRLGHGQDYQYPHDFPQGFVEQDYLGVAKTYYHPTDRGQEQRLREYLARFRSAMSEVSPPSEEPH
jgi:putative ATPase